MERGPIVVAAAGVAVVALVYAYAPEHVHAAFATACAVIAVAVNLLPSLQSAPSALATRLQEEHGLAATEVASRSRLTATLYQKVAEGDTKPVTLLVQAGADVNVQAGDANAAPLHLAVTNGDAAMVDKLVSCRASLDVPMYDGKTALHLAAMDAKTGMVRALLAAGARTDFADREGNFTPLMLAAAYTKDAQVVNLLIDAGVSIEARDKTGMTALDYAIASKNDEAAKKLTAAGAKTSKVVKR
jgi:hypothetical protein